MRGKMQRQNKADTAVQNQATAGQMDNAMLYLEAEEAANRFSLRVLSVMIVFAFLAEALNEWGLFLVNPFVMRLSVVAVFLLFSVPVVMHLAHDRRAGCKNPFIGRDFFHKLIIVVTFLGVALIGVALSFHTVILLVIPPLLAAQYRNRRRLFWWILAASMLLVPISVYGSFFFGAPDRNLLKILDIENATLQRRLELATPTRMWEVFLHYVLPRLLCMLAVVAVAVGINRRNANMLNRQTELSQKVQLEMENRNRIQNYIIEALAALIEARDTNTGEHVIRTRMYVTMIARAMQQDPRFANRLTDTDIERIQHAAPLHDVGKIVVSDTILLKPGKLTPEEYDAMKVHTVKGGHMIHTLFKDLDDPELLRVAEQIAISHHEKWNGQGYPEGKQGEDIPLAARIMAVADVYDALVSTRVYKPALQPKEALDIMFAESGTHFDPAIMDVVRDIQEDLVAVASSPVA